MKALGYHLAKGLESLRTSPVMVAVAVTTIGVTILLLGAVLTLLNASDRLADRWGGEVSVVAFVRPEVDASQLAALAREVEAWPEVSRVVVHGRAETLADFRASLGAEAALLDGVDPALLPASLEVALGRAGDPAPVVGRLGALGGVEDVSRGEDLLARLQSMRAGLRWGGLALAGLVLLAVVFIIANTVLLGLYARRDEIAIMQLVGATRGFVRGGFYVEGAVQGLLGAGLGLILLGVLRRLALEQPDLPALVHQLIVPLPGPWAAGLLLGSGALGVVASHLCVGRFLRAAGPM